MLGVGGLVGCLLADDGEESMFFKIYDYNFFIFCGRHELTVFFSSFPQKLGHWSAFVGGNFIDMFCIVELLARRISIESNFSWTFTFQTCLSVEKIN